MPRKRPIPGRSALFGAVFGCLLATSAPAATIFEAGAANVDFALRWPQPMTTSLGLAGLARRQAEDEGRQYLLPLPKQVRRQVTIKAAAPVGYAVYHAGTGRGLAEATARPDRSVVIGHWSPGGYFGITVRLGLAGGLALTFDLPPPPPPRLAPVTPIRVAAILPPADPPPAAVPLPGAGGLALAGLAALGLLRARRRS